MKRIIGLLLSLLLLFVCVSGAFADEPPYRSYAYSTEGWPFYMQTPYLPVEIIGQTLYAPEDGSMLPGFSAPTDLFVDSQDFVYVADKGKNRIVKTNKDGELLAEIGLDVLKSPEGVCVTRDGTIVVADTGNARVAVFDRDGQVLRLLSAPDDVRLQGILFTPTDVAVDDRGYIYVLLKGGNEGLLIMNPEGKFQGYFGRNATQLTFGEKVKRLFYTQAQIATNANAVAPSITGMYVGENGFVYTCTSTLSAGQIKRFNASGNDLFDNLDTQVIVNRANEAKSAVSSLYVNADGVIYAIDNTNGAVIIYDANGKPLAMFGEKLSGNEKRIGYFSDPTGISVLSDGTLLVLDRAYNGIHVFRPTTLMYTILHAVTLYNDGQYTVAEEDWHTILKANANYYWANLGLGKIAYMQKDWQTAMQQMKLARNQEFYSDALWKYRAETVQKNAGTVVLVLLAFFACSFLLSKLTGHGVFGWLKKGLSRFHHACIVPLGRKMPLTSSLLRHSRFALGVLRHPVDTYYEATRRGMGSVPSALMWYLVFLAVMVGERALTNFVFDMDGLEGLSVVSALLTYVLPVLLWVLGNYLVGAITKGQGTFSGILIGTVYALMPLILFSLPIALLSNGLTLMEGSIYWIARTILYLWTGLLLFMQVKEIHGYEIGETVKNILWILFVAAMAVVAVVTVAAILVQGYNFLNEFLRELLGYV